MSWASTSSTGPAGIWRIGWSRTTAASKGDTGQCAGLSAFNQRGGSVAAMTNSATSSAPAHPIHQPVSANRRRLHVLCAATTALSILQAA